MGEGPGPQWIRGYPSLVETNGTCRLSSIARCPISGVACVLDHGKCPLDTLNSGVTFNLLPTNDAYMHHELP